MTDAQELRARARTLLDRSDWVLRREAARARAWSLDMGRSPPALRFEIELDCPASACADYAIERLLETQGEWNSSFMSGEVEDQADGSRIYHMTYRGVWPVAPRDFVYRAWLQRGEDGAMTEVSASVDAPRPGPVAGVVRGRIVLAWREVVALGPDRCRYVSLAQSDVAGRVPVWMVTPGIVKNMFAELGDIRDALAD